MIDSLLNDMSPTLRGVRTRFDPSPTGNLHLGHLYAAMVAHDLAQKLKGEYLLRFEDIDRTRVRKEYYDSILEDLYFFNFEHAEPPIGQLTDDRVLAYAAALNRLEQLGVTYPCFCTRKDIANELKSLTNAPHAEDILTQHYPRTCRKLTLEEIDSNLKADIGTSYHIASVVDDAHQKISHVTRGDDLLESTHLHRILQTLLGFQEPIYLHHPLVVDIKNERLAKRSKSISIKKLRELGYDRKSLLEMMQQQLQK